MAIKVEKINGETVFTLDTVNSTYAMAVRFDSLINLYYGKKVEGDLTYLIPHRVLSFGAYEEGKVSTEIYRLECPSFGNGDHGTAMLEIEDADGINVSDFVYKDYKVYTGKRAVPGLPSAYSEKNDTPCLDITLRDEYTGVEAVLTYSVFEECDCIVKSVCVKNTSDKTVFLNRCLSSSTGFADDDFDVIILKGLYAVERMVKRYPLEGTAKIFSNRGASGHGFNPFMALVRPETTENCGDAFGTAFIYSGNFMISAEDGWQNDVRWTIGIDPDGFRWKLEGGDEFYSPEAVLTYSDKGIGGMSRCFHDFGRAHITRGEWKYKKRPLLINNWEGTYFNFDGQKIYDIAKKASELGIEMAVLDDGWFGARNGESAGLGDWKANEEKLGMTLGELSDIIHDLGMKFGLWFEPEMINLDSDLYRAHPDYAFVVKGRPALYSRRQLVLDFSRKEVVDNIYEQMKEVLAHAKIDYIKWDFNRNLSQVCSYVLDKDRQGEVFHRYMLGLYDLLERLTKNFPHILFESCSGGGGRCDFGILAYMQQNWASDNTDAIHRLEIQHGTSMVYPVRTIGSHYTAINPYYRTVSPETRAEVARFGSNGYELDLTKLSDEESEKIRGFNKEFHKYYDLVNFGDLYRLVNVFEKTDSAWMFVSKDKSEALVNYISVLKRCSGVIPNLKLQGLDPSKVYVEEYSGKEYAGSTLMNAGIPVTDIYRDFAASKWHFVEKKA